MRSESYFHEHVLDGHELPRDLQYDHTGTGRHDLGSSYIRHGTKYLCVCVCVYVASRGHVLGGMIGSRYDTLPYVLLCTNGGTVRMVCLRRYPVKFKFEISAQTTLLGFGFFLSWVERFWARTRLSLRDAIRPQGRT